MGTGQGHGAPANPNPNIFRGEPTQNLELSLESSFFDGSSFNDDCGKALANLSAQNLEELLQADDVDPDTFLIKTVQGTANDLNTSAVAAMSAKATNGSSFVGSL